MKFQSLFILSAAINAIPIERTDSNLNPCEGCSPFATWWANNPQKAENILFKTLTTLVALY
jgi:hypothetical protein